jgi:hypothetical protein
VSQITNKPEPILFLPDALGIYIPSHFASYVSFDQLRNVTQEDYDSISDTEDEFYWESWDAITASGQLLSKGIVYNLHQDGDLWLIPEGVEWSDKEEWFIWPEIS